MKPGAVLSHEHEISDADAMDQFLVDAYGTSMHIYGAAGPRVLRHRRTDAGPVAVETAYQSADLGFEVQPLNKIVVTRTVTSRLERASDGAGPVAVETAYQSADLGFEVQPLNKIVVTRTVTSRLERASDGAGRRYDAGELFLMSEPDRAYTARWLPGEIQNCIIDVPMLAKVAASAPARPGPIRFTSLDPLSPAAAAQWWATHSYVADLLPSLGPDNFPLLVDSAAQLLAAATLTTFPNTAVADPTIADRHDAHPATLRRAVAFIDEHAHEDISTADIAAAAFVSVRAVQLAFRRHMGTTPLEYLRRVRLDHAHRDLLAGDPAHETVTAIAYRWGFPSPSRFAARYRQTYGVLPSHTLRRD